MPDVTALRGGLDLSQAAPVVRANTACSGSEPRVVVLIPAYNEAESIEATLDGLMNQVRMPDRIVVIPNGCRDDTAKRARKYPVTVLELARLPHGKSEALNIGWRTFARDAEVVICLDADTVLPPPAIGAWAAEFEGDDGSLGGSSSKFTMHAPDFLAGTGCAINNQVLRELAKRPDREGPWIYTSPVEDYELTHRIRELGNKCRVSPSGRAGTDTMKTIRALWEQRMKWRAGTPVRP